MNRLSWITLIACAALGAEEVHLCATHDGRPWLSVDWSWSSDGEAVQDIRLVRTFVRVPVWQITESTQTSRSDPSGALLSVRIDGASRWISCERHPEDLQVLLVRTSAGDTSTLHLPTDIPTLSSWGELHALQLASQGGPGTRVCYASIRTAGDQVRLVRQVATQEAASPDTSTWQITADEAGATRLMLDRQGLPASISTTGAGPTVDVVQVPAPGVVLEGAIWNEARISAGDGDPGSSVAPALRLPAEALRWATAIPGQQEANGTLVLGSGISPLRLHQRGAAMIEGLAHVTEGDGLTCQVAARRTAHDLARQGFLTAVIFGLIYDPGHGCWIGHAWVQCHDRVDGSWWHYDPLYPDRPIQSYLRLALSVDDDSSLALRIAAQRLMGLGTSLWTGPSFGETLGR